MPHLIDRRLNPRDKSLGNRQRFLRRARAQIKEAVNKAINDRNVSDVGDGGKISIPSRGIGEPRFRHDIRGGRRERVLRLEPPDGPPLVFELVELRGP